MEDISSSSNDKIQALIQARLVEAINTKRTLINANSAGAFITFFRYLSLVQTDESWCKHLSRLDILKEEMVLQSFTAERDVLEIYKEKADLLFANLFNDVRRNSVYSLFIYKPTAEMNNWASK
jgi:preprotein translocase subunit SecA